MCVCVCVLCVCVGKLINTHDHCFSVDISAIYSRESQTSHIKSQASYKHFHHGHGIEREWMACSAVSWNESYFICSMNR